MNCRKTSSLISAYIDGELQSTDHQIVREHINLCAECRDEYDGIVQMKHALSNIQMHAPRPEFSNQIMARIHDETSKQNTTRLPRWELNLSPRRRLWLGASLAGLAIVGVIAFSKDPNEIRWTSTVNEPKLTSATNTTIQDSSFYSPRGSYAAPVVNSYTRYGEPEPIQGVPRLSSTDNLRTHPRTPNPNGP